MLRFSYNTRAFRLAEQNQRQIVGLARLPADRPGHTPVRQCHQFGRVLYEPAGTNALHDLIEMNIVRQAVACDQDRIARAQFDTGTDIYAHVAGAQEIGDEMPVFVVQRVPLVQETRLDGEPGR